MSRDRFAAECASRTIDPAIALENEEVVAALMARDDEAVIDALDSQF